jgi:parvulin-like peptidyl-prolyl isomerase
MKAGLKAMALAVGALGVAATAGRAEILERIVAKVNGEIITKTEFEREVAMNLERLGPAPSPQEEERRLAELRKEVLDGMVEKLLVLQRAREKGLRIPPRFFDEWKTNIMKENRIESEEEFLRQIKLQGMTLEQLKKQFEEGVMVQEVRRMDIANKVSVNEPEIAKHYREHIAKYSKPAQVRLREIVFRFEPDGEAAARERATRVLQDIRQGADFAEMARRHSESGSKDSGGDLGYFNQGELDAPLEKVASELGPGAVSDLVRREKAFYILKVEEKTEEKSTPLEEVRNQIADEIFQNKVKLESEKYVEKLRAEAIIEIIP